MVIRDFDLTESVETRYAYFAASGFSSAVKVFQIAAGEEKEKEKSSNPKEEISKKKEGYVYKTHTVNSDAGQISFEKYTQIQCFQSSVDTACFNPR